MSGEELIRWAMARCKQEGLPPHDGDLIRHIRELYDVAKLPKVGDPSKERDLTELYRTCKYVTDLETRERELGAEILTASQKLNSLESDNDALCVKNAALQQEVDRLTTQISDIADDLGCKEKTSHRHSHGRCIFSAIAELRESNRTPSIEDVFNAVKEAFPIEGTLTNIHKIAFEAGVSWHQNWLIKQHAAPSSSPPETLESVWKEMGDVFFRLGEAQSKLARTRIKGKA